ncbi:BAG domain-containing protein [Tanacetum coccineum]
MPYAPNDDPRAKEITPHMKMDPSTTISPYQQPWPYGAINAYPVPHEYHGCCNHGYYGGGPYSYRPPYPHYPPPPPSFYSHGFYPPFPGAYPGYHILPPHYSVEQPRYDYDKKSHDGHRCSSCNRVEDEKKPRIVQEEPEVDKKTNDSLVPLLLKDCPYPIMWVPPGYMKTEPEVTEKENKTRDPVSSKHLEPVKQGGNGEIARNHKDEDDYNGFPYQIFWLPSKNKEMENDTKENNADLVADRGVPDEEKLPRMKKHDSSGSETKSDTSSKHAVQKVIPVKQLLTNEGQKSPKAIQTKAKSDSVKNTDNDIEGKASPKTSKLPPVCLRIDPLPGKKKSSRSPSPPADKQRSKGSTSDHPKTSQQQMELSEGLKKGKDEQSKSNIKNIQVTDDVKKVEEDRLAGPCEDASKGEETRSGKEMARKVEKKLSEHKAALIIQSAYRGFEVRKSQPLTKLRQINGVRKQVAELRNRIQDLESSSSAIRIDDKQKLIIGETIMSLLLKLDTIQGLHPVVRDARKSVAKELVGLQEELDSLTLVKSETPSVEIAPDTERVTHLEEDAIQDKSDQEHAQSDSNVKIMDSDLGACEDHEVKATESQGVGGELCDTNIKQQVELRNEKTTEESINNQLHVSVESKQPVDNASADKLDQPHAQSDCNTETVESDTCGVKSREAEDTNAVHETYDVKPEQVGEQGTKELNINQHEMSVESELPLDDAIQEKHEADESVTNIEFEKSDKACAEVGDINLDAQVESESQQDTVELTSNQLEMVVETESPVDNGIQSDTNVEFVESDDSCADVHDVNLEVQVESRSQQDIVDNQLEMSEKEQTVEEAKPDQAQAQSDQTEAQSESNVEIVESCERPEVVGVTEYLDDGSVITHDKELVTECIQLPPKAMVDIDSPIEDATNKVQEDFIVSTEEAPKADDADSSTEFLIEDLRGISPLSPTGSRGDDKKLLEENERLRVAVEELMKAGNQQLDVIKELTGRVKDLEKKLSKKKKVKLNKGRCRGSVVKDELRSDHKLKEALDASEKLIEANPEFMTTWNYSKLPFDDKLQALINEEFKILTLGVSIKICHYDESERVALMEEDLHKFLINASYIA